MLLCVLKKLNFTLTPIIIPIIIIFLEADFAHCEYMDFRDDYPIDALVMGIGVRVREAPNIKSKVITQLAFGSYAQLLDRSDQSDSFHGKHAYYWLKVKVRSGQTGWIWGRYLVYYYPKQQNLDTTMQHNGKTYELNVVEVEYPPYIDYKNSKIDSEYGLGGTLMPFFMEKGDKYNLRFIRNDKASSKSNALENYWKVPVACCGSDSRFSDVISTSDDLYLGRIWETDGEIEKKLFTIEKTDQSDFILKDKEILYTTASAQVAVLIDEHIKTHCADEKGWFTPDSIIETDLTDDGKKDLIISHDGLNCQGELHLNRSSACGFRACSAFLYVREGSLLVRKADILSIGVSIGAGKPPAIHFTSHTFVKTKIRWNGYAFN